MGCEDDLTTDGYGYIVDIVSYIITGKQRDSLSIRSLNESLMGSPVAPTQRPSTWPLLGPYICSQDLRASLSPRSNPG